MFDTDVSQITQNTLFSEQTNICICACARVFVCVCACTVSNGSYCACRR